MASQPKVEATVIVFDQGNTLLMEPFYNVIKRRENRFNDLCSNYGLSITSRQLIDEWAVANKEVDYPYIAHFYQEEPTVQLALRKLGVPETIAALLALALLREYRIGLKELISTDPRTYEVKNTLQKLNSKGKMLGVFSNDRIVGLNFVLDAMGVKSFFKYVETSESIGVEKPDPQVFQHMLGYFRQSPEFVVYVGDDPIRDIDGAKSQGLKAIKYCVDVDQLSEPWRNYKTKPRFKPDAVIDHFSQLIDVVK